MKRASLLTAGIVMLLGYAGCGGDSAPPNTPPPDDKAIVSLNDSELGALCTQLATIEGGYSNPHELTCEGGTSTVTFSIGTSQMSCKLAFTALPAGCSSLTVDQFRSCVADTYAETCATFATAPPSCDPYYSCLIPP